ADLRADRLPGAGAEGRPDPGRLYAWPGRPAPPGHGQEEEGDPGQGVRPVPPGRPGPRLLRQGHPGCLGCAGPVRRLRLQQGALGRVRPGLVLDGLPQGELPGEYMAALLTSVGDDKDKSALYLSECRRMGIRVLPPDVNESVATFAPVGKDIRFGLAAIRNVGVNVVEAIISARKSKGEFTGFSDFLRKVPLVVCNKRVIESLIKAGAFDSFQDARKGLVLVHEQAVDAVIDIKRNEAIGQDSLFGGDIESDAVFDVPVPAGEWDKSTL